MNEFNNDCIPSGGSFLFNIYVKTARETVLRIILTKNNDKTAREIVLRIVFSKNNKKTVREIVLRVIFIKNNKKTARETVLRIIFTKNNKKTARKTVLSYHFTKIKCGMIEFEVVKIVFLNKLHLRGKVMVE